MDTKQIVFTVIGVIGASVIVSAVTAIAVAPRHQPSASPSSIAAPVAQPSRYHFRVDCPGYVLFESLTVSPPIDLGDRWKIPVAAAATYTIAVPPNCVPIDEAPKAWTEAPTGDLAAYMPVPPQKAPAPVKPKPRG